MVFNIININASRIGKREKLLELYAAFMIYKPDVVCIQEINIRNATRYYQDQFQIIGNKDENQNDDIGILTLIKKGTPIKENILGENGRIIGTKLSECQIWNVYPPSGANFKSQREIFF